MHQVAHRLLYKEDLHSYFRLLWLKKVNFFRFD